MTDEVVKKRGRKPKVVEDTLDTVQEAPEQALESIESIDEAEGTADVQESQEGPAEADIEDVADQATDVTESATEEDIEATPEQAEETDRINDEIRAELGQSPVVEAVESMEELQRIVVNLPEGFMPLLRPTMVGDEPKGHMPCPKGIFDLITTDADWRSKIDSHPAKVGLQSVVHWQDKLGDLQVRCMSSSKFGVAK